MSLKPDTLEVYEPVKKRARKNKFRVILHCSLNNIDCHIGDVRELNSAIVLALRYREVEKNTSVYDDQGQCVFRSGKL